MHSPNDSPQKTSGIGLPIGSPTGAGPQTFPADVTEAHIVDKHAATQRLARYTS